MKRTGRLLSGLSGAVAVMVMVILFGSGAALADDAAVARWNLAKKTAWFAAGYFSGHLLHEGGHLIMSKIENVDMGWSEYRWHADTPPNGKLRNIAFGGFGADVFGTEIILGVDKIPKDNAYVLGVLAYDLVDFFIYPIRSELQNGYGDLETLRRTGFDTGLVEVSLIAYGSLTVYRLYKKSEFMPYIRVTRNEFIFGVSWGW